MLFFIANCAEVLYNRGSKFVDSIQYMNEIQEKLKLLPDDPGVYIMLDKDGNVIYVGKARVLKNRVRQYFHSTLKTEKVAAMVSNIADSPSKTTSSKSTSRNTISCSRTTRRIPTSRFPSPNSTRPSPFRAS